MYYSGLAAVFLAALAWAFIELFARLYPSRETWARMRKEYGRSGVQGLRERIEAAARTRAARYVLVFMGVLVIAWIASASLLDKRWWEVALEVLPYAIIGGALLRAPGALRSVAARMRDYERASGDDQGPGPLAA
jgi:hypothetical protein